MKLRNILLHPHSKRFLRTLLHEAEMGFLGEGKLLLVTIQNDAACIKCQPCVRGLGPLAWLWSSGSGSMVNWSRIGQDIGGKRPWRNATAEWWWEVAKLIACSIHRDGEGDVHHTRDTLYPWMG